MLKSTIIKLYQKLRMESYRMMFGTIHEKSGSLSATEAFSADVIYLLGNPTVTKFADTIGISQPNATYKINSLVEKGYIEKKISETDKREVQLRTSEKFRNYFHESYENLGQKIEGLKGKFTEEELSTAECVIEALVTAMESEDSFDRSV